MQKRKQILSALNVHPIFEALERREMMSLTLPTQNVLELQSDAVVQKAALVKKAPKVAAVVSTTGTGLTGEYFSDANFTTGYELRNDATLKLTPNAKRDPVTVLANSVRWTGKLSPTYSEDYAFSVVANGGIRLWVNGQLLINQAASSGGNFASTAAISLVAGEHYTVTVEYTRRSAAGVKVALNWSSLHQKLGLVPQKALFPDSSATLPATTAGLIGQYYIGKNFDKLVMQRADPGIDFNFKAAAPTFLIPKGSPFSIRWTGQIVPTYSQTYTFSTTTDDGVRLYVDDQLVIDNWTDHTATTNTAQVTLVAGQAYDIRMDYYEDHGVASAKLQWSSPSQVLEVVPASALTSTPVATAGTLLATATSSSSIHLDWSGSASATGYLVEQSTDSGMTYSTIATTAAGVTQYDVTGLEPATDYLFRIAPVGSADTSTPSNPSMTGTETDSPAGISATPTSSTTATLNWSNVSGENGFNIYQAAPAASSGLTTSDVLSGPTFTQIGSVKAGVTTFDVTGLSSGSAYQFAIRAINSDGALSDLSDIATATTPTDAPDSAPVATVTAGLVTLTFPDVAGETGFSIERSLDGTDGWKQIGTTGTGVLSYVDSTVQPGATYFYRVSAINAGGTSDPSDPVQTVALLTSTPIVSTASTTIGSTTLNWTDVPGEQGFAVLESVDGGNTFSQIALTTSGVNTYTVSNLDPGTQYQFEIEALDSAGNPSVPSNATLATTLAAAPASLIATPVSTTVANINWTDVTGETGFILQRSSDGVTGWSTIVTLPESTLTYSDSTLSAGTSYFYRVAAINGGGTSDPSTVASALTIPAAPLASLTGLSVSQSQVSWSAVTGATSYVVQRSLDGSTNWSTAATSNSLSATVANLATSTKYFYRVQASNASGPSAQSAPVSQVTAPLATYALQSTVYGTDATGAIYSINLTTGTSTVIGQLPIIPSAPTRDPLTGKMYFFQQGTANIYSWDPTTGNTSLLDESAYPSPIVRGAYRADGVGFTIGADGYLREQSPTDAGPTTIGLVKMGNTVLSTTGGNMAFSDSNTLFMLIGSNLYTMNTTTAAATFIASTALGNPLMVFGPKGILYITTGSGNLYSTNLTTAVATLQGNDNLPTFTGLAAVPTFTNLTISASATPTVLVKGQNATFTVQVDNTTGDATNQPIMVTTTLPTGLTYVSAAGTGWTGSVSGQVVTLTYTGTVTANGNLPALTLTVAVGSSTPAVVTTMFTATSTTLDANLSPLPATVISVVT